LLQTVKKLAIYCHEVEDVDQLLHKISCFEEEKAKLQEQVVNLEAEGVKILSKMY
jgi:U3 small nucleolar ribonucleoprotein component